MAGLVNSKQGKNLLGSLQEAPLDDPYLRQEIFDDRLSQSGTTYGEYSSSSQGVRGMTTDRVLGPNGEPLPPLSTRPKPNFEQLRKDEINRAVALQERIVAQIEKLPKTSKNETDLILAQSKLDALKADSDRIHKTLSNREGAKETFMKNGGNWSSAKKNAGPDPSSMKEARWERQEFMDTALQKTAQTFLQTAALKMGVDPTKIVEIPPPPLKPLPSPDSPDYASELAAYEKSLSAQSQYLDGRTRRFQLQMDPPSEQYGSTLTVNFLAPGSTEDTSDIDMQFIVEESPTMCSELIKTFQETAKDELTTLKLGDKSLAERFDMNPYPAGFVFRPELGSDLHFSDTYTEASLDNKKTIDGGLALMRRLDSAKDPKAEIENLVKGLKEPELGNMLRTISVGVEVSLKAQQDRAGKLQPKLNGKPELGETARLLESTTSKIGRQGEPGLWKREATPTIEELATKLGQSQQLAGALGDIAKKEGCQQLVADARNEVYVDSLKRVEGLTKERDLAVSNLGKKVLRYDDEISNLDKELELVNSELQKKPGDEMMLRQRAEIIADRDQVMDLREKAVQEMRTETSRIGVDSFTAQGVALHHADEAYTNRGAIGHVVEQQMGRKFVATSNSAISSIEANHGFILEHFEHDLQHKLDHENAELGEGVPKRTLSDIKGDDLSKFAASVGKYVERIGQTMATVDYRSVVGVKDGPEAEFQKLNQLGKDLASIKKGINPADGKAITDPRMKTALVTVALEKAGITNAQQLKDTLDTAVSKSWQTHLKQSDLGPKAELNLTPEMLQEQRRQLKTNHVTRDTSAPYTAPSVRELLGKQKVKQDESALTKTVAIGEGDVGKLKGTSVMEKFSNPGGSQGSPTTVKEGQSGPGKLRDNPAMAKFMKQREQTEQPEIRSKVSVK